MKSQASLEYMFLTILVLASVAIIVNYSSNMIIDSTNQHYVVYAINLIKDAVSEVGFMGYPARKTLDLYIPPNINSSQTYIMNNSVNYGLMKSTGFSDIFFISDYCVTGNLPTEEGYYPLKVIPSKDCVIIDYNDFSSNPPKIYIILYLNKNATINIVLYNLLFEDVIANLTSTLNLANFVDLDNETIGKQLIKELGLFNSTESITVPVTFFGNQTGIYTGTFTVNTTQIPVMITVLDPVKPIINYTNPSSVIVYLYNNVCLNATVTQGSEEISNVWVSLKIPSPCWAINGSCNPACQYSDLIITNYYNNVACSANCPAAGSFYIPTGSCSLDGTGNCYITTNPVSYNTTCTQGPACNYSCSGIGTNCTNLSIANCTLCGCNLTTIANATIKWNDDLSSNTDWATWTTLGGGIAYVNDATNCIDDDNDDCMQARGGITSYTLTKQSNVNLSNCVLGTASLNISHVKESGNLAGTDCVYVALSNDSGTTWSANYQVFCDDLAGVISYGLMLPNSYLTSNFRVRVTKNGFTTGASRNAWLDGFSATCKVNATICNGTCNNCTVYNNSTYCGACGCNWTANAWNWTASGLTSGYSNYQQCNWQNFNYTYQNISLLDTGASCAGLIGDGIYGINYNMTMLGNYTLLAGYVNDTLGNLDSDIVNINISVIQGCVNNWTINSQALFNEGTYNNTLYNSTINAVTLSGSNLSGTYLSKVFDAGSEAQWISIKWSQANKTFINETNQKLIFNLEETTGTIFNDSSGNNNSGNCTAPGCPILAQPSINGYSASFDGINDYIQANNPMVLNFTVEMLIKTTDTSPTGTQCYEGDGLVWADSGGILTNDSGVALLGNKVCFFTGNPDNSLIGTTNVNDGNWHYIALTRDVTSGIKRIYVDGVLQATGTTNNNPLNANSVATIGGNTYDGLYFNGSMDKIVLSNEVLSQSQILSNYNDLYSSLKVKVMSCSDVSCSLGAWSQEYNKSFDSQLSLSSSRYFRYLFNFISSAANINLKLLNATVYYVKACE